MCGVRHGGGAWKGRTADYGVSIHWPPHLCTDVGAINIM